MYKILFVDDDEMLQGAIRQYFEANQFEVICVGTAQKAADILHTTQLDCVILDVDLPDQSGLELCASIRQFTSLPIIFLSSYTEEENRINGLLVGGDDYIGKPFSLKELELRVLARIRQRYLNSPAEVLTFGDLVIDTGRQTASCLGKEYTFPRLDFDILVFFARHPNQLFSYEQLYDFIWKQPLNESRHNLQARIAKVRQKLCELCPDKEYIKTIRHKGYLFIP